MTRLDVLWFALHLQTIWNLTVEAKRRKKDWGIKEEVFFYLLPGAVILRVSPSHSLFVSEKENQLLSHVQLFATPQTAAHQASLSITNSQSLLKLMSIELVMPSNCFILCHPLLLLPLIFPSIRVFSNESVLHIRWPVGISASASVQAYHNSCVPLK